MIETLVHQVEKDCESKGFGRKAWWARKLGIPPLTLSHWLAGRQNPGGEHALKISHLLGQAEREQKGARFIHQLWELYYSRSPLPIFFLDEIVLSILSKPALDSRTLALLSLVVEKKSPTFFDSMPCFLAHRVGWLLEVSSQKAVFNPKRSEPIQFLLEASCRTEGMARYLKNFQTPWGKKWRIYDCPLDSIKESLPWPMNWSAF